MCGISGWRSFTKEVDKQLLKKMNTAIAHRGPDSSGFFFDDGVGLGFRRLAIIDLSPKGNQPMTSTTGESTIVFNGEIYNYQELRDSVRSYNFRSASDTEVILALYEKIGKRCVKQLRGMFAFAIWNKKELFLARDRLGKKNLYYYYDNKNFLFASELKALLEHPLLEKRTIDESALRQYLNRGYVSAPQSIFNEIKKLPPAHTLTLSASGKLQIEEYWDVDFNKKTQMSEQAATKEIRRLVEESVKLRMISDVPLGAFLSGGIDSSTVVACMAKATDTAVKTFSVGFDEGKYNELRYARLVADKYKTNHKEIMLRPNFLKDMPNIMKFYDEPFADASAIPTYYVAKATRQYVTVALNGDGGDENFAGYTRYVHGLRSRWLRLPSLPKSELPRTGVSRKLELLGMSDQNRFESMNTVFEQRHLFSDKKAIDISSPYYKKPKSLLDKWLYTDIKTYLPGDLLVKVDIATMANSLEGRSPLLDHKLVEFAASLPDSWKISGSQTKVIFKKAVHDLLPREILTKPKQGFAVPMNEWMSGEFLSYVEKELMHSKSEVLKSLDRKKIARLLELQRQGKPHGYRLWTLLMLREWEKQYFS